MPRDLLLLTAYNPPAQHALMIGAAEAACWLNAWSALWHPAALRCGGVPAVASPYDHEAPRPGALYAVPERPTPYLPPDWREGVAEAGAAAFTATPDRGETLAALRDALGDDWVDADARPWFGVGLGYLVIDTLFEAMEHERTLDRDGFWADVLAGRPADAAAKLADARDAVYPAPIHWLDLALVEAGVPLPLGFARGSPLSLIASAETLERLPPETLAAIRERLTATEEESPRLEVCGGAMLERDEVALPLESQLWNLRRGRQRTRELVGADVDVFARRRTAFHPLSPLVLQHAGMTRALFLAFDGARLPSHAAATIQWPSPDGRQVEALAREPADAGDPQTGFHLAHALHATIMKDGTAIMPLLHKGDAAGPWYDDLLALAELAPVLGTWTTAGRYLRDAQVGEYASPASADDFAVDALDSPGEDGKHGHLCSRFASHLKARRRLDAAATCLAMARGLGLPADDALLDHWDLVEERVESGQELAAAEWDDLDRRCAGPLAERLVRGVADRPGLLLLNPCSFTRRVALERDDVAPVAAGPVKAAQPGACVVEVPGFGFAWVPTHPAESPAPRRMTLADARGVRNEFFDAEVDPATGGLRSIRDQRGRDNRIGQQLVFNPGSTMVAKSVRVVSDGPALGEVVSEGAILDGQDRVLATFRQRFRAWLGRPLLELRIELFPDHRPTGYPWHSYYGARFAWRDDRATLLRGTLGVGGVTAHTRPTSPDFLELRSGSARTCLFPGGLPFHQRHGGRMLDVILRPEGETASAFDLAVGLDREHPAQAALGLASPVAVVPVAKGPPPVGPSGWLFHLDAPNLMATSVRVERGAAAIRARLLEVSGFGGGATWRCARAPRDAALLEPDGTVMMPLGVAGDAVPFEVGTNDLVTLRMEW